MKRCLILILTIALGSCTRETIIDNISFPPVDSESKAAVYCLLTPDDSIFVSVKTVQAIDNQSKNGTKSVIGAQIILENTMTGQRIRVPYINQSGIYGCAQRDFPVLPGHTYHLKISVNNSISMQATCRVPTRSATIDTIAYGEPYSGGLFGKRRRVALTWHDVSDDAKPYSYFIGSQYLSDGYTLTNTSFDNTLITQADNQFYYNDDTIDSDTPQTYYLFTTDQNVYTFFTIAQRTKKVSGGNASDFFGGYQGITPTFTNIQNGYGIFGGYLKTSKTISF